MDEQSANFEVNPDDRYKMRREQLQKVLWRGKIGPAFWTTTGTISLIVNIILLVIVLLLGKELFNLKYLISNQLVSGLAENFALMDQAKIETQVVVEDTIPVQFTLPVRKKTTVILSEDAYITQARVNLSTGGLTIRDAPTDILLPAGTPLNILLEMEIPVDTSIPVSLNVPVNIPLNETELHTPFVGLQEVIGPYDRLLQGLPNSWEEALCNGERQTLCPFVKQTNIKSE